MLPFPTVGEEVFGHQKHTPLKINMQHISWRFGRSFSFLNGRFEAICMCIFHGIPNGFFG